ncbi:alcohol dehydrogenase catalytic domain-containing protein, partial [Streptococcus anginosus]|nr:alcohol dehydrogenase catalytic domain-containing protein [Streptococcus anginosus]
MKAVQVRTDTPKQIHITEVPDPVAGAGEVRVRMEWGGICGSDLSYWKNGASGTAIMREPLILGHEVAGVVDQV